MNTFTEADYQNRIAKLEKSNRYLKKIIQKILDADDKKEIIKSAQKIADEYMRSLAKELSSVQPVNLPKDIFNKILGHVHPDPRYIKAFECDYIKLYPQYKNSMPFRRQPDGRYFYSYVQDSWTMFMAGVRSLEQYPFGIETKILSSIFDGYLCNLIPKNTYFLEKNNITYTNKDTQNLFEFFKNGRTEAWGR